MPFRRRAFVTLSALAAVSGALVSGALADDSVPTAPARVDDVSPSAGLSSGGTRVTIEGENFVPPIKIWLGHASCGGVEILSPSELECVASAHPGGTVDLRVKTAREFILKRGVFTYIPSFQVVSKTFVGLGGKLEFRASGGNPPYRFDVVKGSSLIDQSSGVLNASSSPEVGVVRATDSEGHEAEAGYEVVLPLQLYPESPELAVDHSVVITAYGGAPPYRFELVSGGGVFVPDRRTYIAASTPGSAVVRVTDSVQNTLSVTITVKDLPPIPPRLIATGDGFSCAAPTGSVSCWGSNGSEQLGIFSAHAKSEDVATPVAGLSSGVDSIVSGMHHTCVLASGGVKCWGSNEYGQLGDGTGASSATPRQVIGLDSGVLAVSAGDFHTCAVLANSVVCWGRNDSGQLGDGTASQSSVPVLVSGVDGFITAIAAGATHSCAVTNGIAKCWGRNRNGELGDGNRIDQWTPVHVDGLGSGVMAISAGRAHSCAADGSSLKCWGFNGTGNLGASTAADKMKPYDVQLQAPVSVLASRQYHSCGIASGSLYCWGYNYQGEVGDSSYLNRWKPVLVNGFPGPVRDVALSNFHSCAVLVDNQIYCWGDDYYGELGDGGSTRQTSPVRVITEKEKVQQRRKAREEQEKLEKQGFQGRKTQSGDPLQ